MPIEVTRMTEADIDGAIDTIQQAFAEDPYNNWVYPDRSKVCEATPHNPTLHSTDWYRFHLHEIASPSHCAATGASSMASSTSLAIPPHPHLPRSLAAQCGFPRTRLQNPSLGPCTSRIGVYGS